MTVHKKVFPKNVTLDEFSYALPFYGTLRGGIDLVQYATAPADGSKVVKWICVGALGLATFGSVCSEVSAWKYAPGTAQTTKEKGMAAWIKALEKKYNARKEVKAIASDAFKAETGVDLQFIPKRRVVSAISEVSDLDALPMNIAKELSIEWKLLSPAAQAQAREVLFDLLKSKFTAALEALEINSPAQFIDRFKIPNLKKYAGKVASENAMAQDANAILQSLNTAPSSAESVKAFMAHEINVSFEAFEKRFANSSSKEIIDAFDSFSDSFVSTKFPKIHAGTKYNEYKTALSLNTENEIQPILSNAYFADAKAAIKSGASELVLTLGSLDNKAKIQSFIRSASKGKINLDDSSIDMLLKLDNVSRGEKLLATVRRYVEGIPDDKILLYADVGSCGSLSSAAKSKRLVAKAFVDMAAGTTWSEFKKIIAKRYGECLEKMGLHGERLDEILNAYMKHLDSRLAKALRIPEPSTGTIAKSEQELEKLAKIRAQKLAKSATNDYAAFSDALKKDAKMFSDAYNELRPGYVAPANALKPMDIPRRKLVGILGSLNKGIKDVAYQTNMQKVSAAMEESKKITDVGPKPYSYKGGKKKFEPDWTTLGVGAGIRVGTAFIGSALEGEPEESNSSSKKKEKLIEYGRMNKEQLGGLDKELANEITLKGAAQAEVTKLSKLSELSQEGQARNSRIINTLAGNQKERFVGVLNIVYSELQKLAMTDIQIRKSLGNIKDAKDMPETKDPNSTEFKAFKIFAYEQEGVTPKEAEHDLEVFRLKLKLLEYMVGKFTEVNGYFRANNPNAARPMVTELLQMGVHLTSTEKDPFTNDIDRQKNYMASKGISVD